MEDVANDAGALYDAQYLEESDSPEMQRLLQSSLYKRFIGVRPPGDLSREAKPLVRMHTGFRYFREREKILDQCAAEACQKNWHKRQLLAGQEWRVSAKRRPHRGSKLDPDPVARGRADVRRVAERRVKSAVSRSTSALNAAPPRDAFRLSSAARDAPGPTGLGPAQPPPLERALLDEVRRERG